MSGDPKGLIANARAVGNRLRGRVKLERSADSLDSDAAEIVPELADALASTYRDYNHQVYLRDKDREASWKLAAGLERERDEARGKVKELEASQKPRPMSEAPKDDMTWIAAVTEVQYESSRGLWRDRGGATTEIGRADGWLPLPKEEKKSPAEG